MQQLIAVWSNLTVQRRIVVIFATVAMFATVLILSRMAAAPSFALLYSGLDNSAAGEVVRALEQRGVAYEVRGGAIYVDRSARDELRMTLASEGLPANSAAGYELLDNLSGFGTTSQMFDAAYLRAKEGELARTILANPLIRSARVHIAAAAGQPFRREVKPTASVSVMTGGGTLSPTQAKALKYLVASSVAGMAPEDVSIIGSDGSLIMAGDDSAASSEEDRSKHLKHNVERLLAARMGPGKAVVEVSVETVTERESIVERRIDPEGRVVISTDTEERNSSASDNAGGAVTVASNLPDGNGATGDSSSNTNAETRERVNFEVSETQREVHRTPGAVKRISVAVLLDGTRRIDDTGTEIWEPLPDTELQDLQELVASAVGFDASRGDVVTLKSMPFEPAANEGTLVEQGLIDRLNLDLMSVIQLLVLGAVALILGLFVIRPVFAGRGSVAAAALPSPARQVAGGLQGEIDPDTVSPEQMSVVSQDGRRSLPAPAGGPVPDPVSRLRQLIDDRQSETVEILRSWMGDETEKVR